MYDYPGSGAGGVSLGPMTENPSYLRTREAAPRVTFENLAQVESKAAQIEDHYNVISSEPHQEVQEEVSDHDGEADDGYVID